MTSRDLLMAYRWNAAVVLSSLVLTVTAAKLLSRPIPIAIKGGLQVDKLVLPPSVTIPVSYTHLTLPTIYSV